MIREGEGDNYEDCDYSFLGISGYDCQNIDPDDDDRLTNIGTVILLGNWFYSMVSAHTAAERFNEEQFKGGTRKPALAGTLSLALSGLGQLYNRQPGKTCVFAMSEIFAWGLIVAAFAGDIDDDAGNFGGIWFTGTRILAATDAYNTARERNQQKPVTFIPITNRGRLGAKLSLKF